MVPIPQKFKVLYFTNLLEMLDGQIPSTSLFNISFLDTLETPSDVPGLDCSLLGPSTSGICELPGPISCRPELGSGFDVANTSNRHLDDFQTSTEGFNGSAAVSESQQELSFVSQAFDSSDQEIIARSESYFGSDFTETPVVTTQSTLIQDKNLRETKNSTECGFSAVTKFYQRLSLARSRCYAGLEALNSINIR